MFVYLFGATLATIIVLAIVGQIISSVFGKKTNS
jgi:hypothetical protein